MVQEKQKTPNPYKEFGAFCINPDVPGELIRSCWGIVVIGFSEVKCKICVKYLYYQESCSFIITLSHRVLLFSPNVANL